MHGVFQLATDVEALVLDPSFRGTETEDEARALGVPVGWHEGRRLSVAELDRHPDFRGPHIVAVGHRIADHEMLDAAVLGRAAPEATRTRTSSSGCGTTSPASAHRHSGRSAGAQRAREGAWHGMPSELRRRRACGQRHARLGDAGRTTPAVPARWPEHSRRRCRCCAAPKRLSMDPYATGASSGCPVVHRQPGPFDNRFEHLVVVVPNQRVGVCVPRSDGGLDPRHSFVETEHLVQRGHSRRFPVRQPVRSHGPLFAFHVGGAVSATQVPRAGRTRRSELAPRTSRCRPPFVEACDCTWGVERQDAGQDVESWPASSSSRPLPDPRAVDAGEECQPGAVSGTWSSRAFWSFSWWVG